MSCTFTSYIERQAVKRLDPLKNRLQGDSRQCVSPTFVVHSSIRVSRLFSLFPLQGIVCIPMGMSYALLANLPPVYGLYTSLVPPLMYLLFGTCNQLSLGVSPVCVRVVIVIVAVALAVDGACACCHRGSWESLSLPSSLSFVFAYSSVVS